ncbi:MAG: alanine racemase [Kiritimatiellae bacterium]|nr:alanine racemase [Kiritimatiellia bacterium]
MKHCWAEVNLGALEENIRRMQTVLRPETQILFVVKADAYGHGAVPVAKRAAEVGVRWFGVAYLHEALEIRPAVERADILILGVVDSEDVPTLFKQRITPIVADEEHGLALAAAARKAGAILPVHVKIDTGMGRLGLPWEHAEKQLLRLCGEEGLDVRGVCSHFAMVETSEPQAAATQAERFFKITRAVEKRIGRKFFKHISSSRAMLYHKEWDLDAVRPGIMLYGYGTAEDGVRVETCPMLQWKTAVTHVKSVPANFPVGYYSTYVTSRPTDIAVIACGYADGYLRTLSNRGHVLIHGRRCPVVGRVSMNWIAADVGPHSGVKRGDEVVLIGEQGEEAVWANELAALCRTIAYEILTGINARVERRYIG